MYNDSVLFTEGTHEIEDCLDALVFEDVIPYLTLSEICRLQVSHSLAHRMVLDNESWHQVARRELQAVDLNLESLPDKQFIKLLSATLKGIVKIGSLPVTLSNFSQASRLATTIRKFQARASKHILNGGKVANTLMGCFQFDTGMMTISERDEVLNLSPHLAADIAWSDGEQTCAIEIALALSADTMYVTSRADMSNEEQCLPKMLLDIEGINPALLLQKRKIVVNSDAFEQGTGLYSREGSRMAAEVSLTKGLLCVMLVYDDNTPVNHPIVTATILNTLHLDAMQWTVPDYEF